MHAQKYTGHFNIIIKIYIKGKHSYIHELQISAFKKNSATFTVPRCRLTLMTPCPMVPEAPNTRIVLADIILVS